MTFFDAAVLGVVEGLTEFLPVSSTGHLVLASRLLGLPQTEFLKSFEIAIQLGAIGAVLMLYWRKLFGQIATFKRVAAAFLPTAVVGYALYAVIRSLLGSDMVVVAALVIGGVVMLAFEKWQKPPVRAVTSIQDMGYKTAALIGLCQAIAVVPGVSRSGATIIGGLALGVSRAAVVEFSFLLAVPTIAAATALDLYKNAALFSAADAGILAVGFLVSFVTAAAAVKFFLRYVQHHSFAAFGWYRIAAALAYVIIV